MKRSRRLIKKLNVPRETQGVQEAKLKALFHVEHKRK